MCGREGRGLEGGNWTHREGIAGNPAVQWWQTAVKCSPEKGKNNTDLAAYLHVHPHCNSVNSTSFINV